MPTLYKPKIDHVPMDPEAISAQINVFLDQHAQDLILIARGNLSDIEDEEINHFRRTAMASLFQFVAQCKSRPVRSQNMVVATLTYIAKVPEDFIAWPGAYDAEAVDALYVAYGGLSPEHKAGLMQFEIGHEALVPSDVRAAAMRAIEGYQHWLAERRGESKKPSGAPRNDLLREFAQCATRCYGAVSDHPPTPTENGAFEKFVTLLRRPVFEEARAAGCILNPARLSRLAVQRLRTAQQGRKIQKALTALDIPYF